MLTHGLLDRARRNIVMGSVPDGLAVSQNDCLRRFMLNACARRYLVRHVARALHDDKRNVRLDLRHLLVSRTADRACRAMLEQNDGRIIRARDELIQGCGVCDLSELVSHESDL